MERIYIVGAGSIGKALAVFLQRAGREVTLVRGRSNSNGATSQSLEVEVNSTTVRAEVKTMDLEHLANAKGIVVVTVKSFGNKRVAASLNPAIGNPIVLLQNGLGVEEPFIHYHHPTIYRCVLFVTSQLLESGAVRFKPVAPCPVGILHGTNERLLEIVSLLSTPDFQFVPAPDIQKIVWEKAIMNTVFNSICPLLEIDNGVFYRETAALELARSIITAGVRIAASQGLVVNAHEIETGLLRISRSSAGQFISTLQDIRQGRPTEIETLNFALKEIALAAGLKNETYEIGLLGELTRLKARLNQKEA
ncbi:MAG: 2-dehydropantoate 2-reductase [Cyclobacteriaceae bacterium]|nr:2-dehydropantoate 2-reductase [Cyclobacteriaceae bacterium]